MKLLTYPNAIAGGQRMFHFMNILNVDHTKDLNDSDITHIMHYNYSNRIDRCPVELVELSDKLNTPVINGNLLNIKKDHIDDVFSSIFGYSIRLDPTTHKGYCLKRSTQNAIHFGKFVECPIKPEEVDREPRVSHGGEPHYRMYVKVIDTRIDIDKIRDFRVAFIGGKPVMLFEKHLDVRSMFHPKKGRYFEAWAHKSLTPSFTDDEALKIAEFGKRMGIDYAEVDILRDNSTGLIYIIDVNPVPGGALINMLGEKIKKELANHFKQSYL